MCVRVVCGTGGIFYLQHGNSELWQVGYSSPLLFSHSVVSDSAMPWIAPPQASLSFTISWSPVKLMPSESVRPSNHLILCHPLFFLPSNFLSTRVFSSQSALHIKWPKYWSFSFNIRPSNEYSGLISFRTDWFDPATVGVTCVHRPRCTSPRAPSVPLYPSPPTTLSTLPSLHL